MASKRHSAGRTALAIILTGLLAFGFPAPALAEIAFTATDLDLMEGEGQAEDTPAAEDPASTEPAQPEIHQVEVEDGTWFYIEARTGSNGLIIRSADGTIDTSSTSGVMQRYLVGFKLKEVTPDPGGDEPEPTPDPGGDEPEPTPAPENNGQETGTSEAPAQTNSLQPEADDEGGDPTRPRPRPRARTRSRTSCAHSARNDSRHARKPQDLWSGGFAG